MSPTDDFHKNAARCLALANATTDPKQKTEWMRLSEEWTRMAAAAHIRPDAFDAK
jgi:hypothetical protein